MHSTDNGLTSGNNVTKRDGTGLIGQGPPLEVNVEVIDGDDIENFRPMSGVTIRRGGLGMRRVVYRYDDRRHR